MKRVTLAICALLSAVNAHAPQERTNRTSVSGTWVQHGNGDKKLDDAGWVIGKSIFVAWKDFEKEDGVFDFSVVDRSFADAVAAGFQIQTAVGTGSSAPGYILKKGVKVRMSSGHSCAHVSDFEDSGADEPPWYEAANASTVGSETTGSCTWPDYMSEFYQSRFLRAIDKFAEHVGSSHAKRAVVSSQAMFGTTGDDGPYHGTAEDKKNAISRDEWESLTLKLAPDVCKSYSSRGIHVLWNSYSFEKMLELCPNSFLKTGMVSHGYQSNDEMDNYAAKSKWCHKEGFHCRGETWAFSQHGDFKEDPVRVAYAHMLWQLTFGVDIPGFSSNTLLDSKFTPLYRNVYNRFATSIRPPADKWAGAILMLRDGLNSANTERFLESKYGKASQTNADRMKKIVKDFAHRGAKLGDPHAATGSSMVSRAPKKANDIGWKIWENNYGNGLLTQLAPQETSVGVWQLGPKDQEYGRFARQFEASSGKTAMGFILDTDLVEKWVSANSKPLVFSVAYFDGAAHAADAGAERTLVVSYDGKDGCTHASLSVGNSNRWKVWTKTISNGTFAKGCFGTGTKADGADIMLRSTGGDVAVSTLSIYDPAQTF